MPGALWTVQCVVTVLVVAHGLVDLPLPFIVVWFKCIAECCVLAEHLSRRNCNGWVWASAFLVHCLGRFKDHRPSAMSVIVRFGLLVAFNVCDISLFVWTQIRHMTGGRPKFDQRGRRRPATVTAAADAAVADQQRVVQTGARERQGSKSSAAGSQKGRRRSSSSGGLGSSNSTQGKILSVLAADQAAAGELCSLSVACGMVNDDCALSMLSSALLLEAACVQICLVILAILRIQFSQCMHLHCMLTFISAILIVEDM
jgi:hypothetical protein